MTDPVLEARFKTGNDAFETGNIASESATVSRREFLFSIGALGLGATLGGRILDIIFAAEEIDTLRRTVDPDHQWVMVFDLRRCDGCRDCIKGCQAEHHLPESAEWIKVHEMVDTRGKSFSMPVLCMECQEAPCVRVCPVQATYYRPDGVIVVDENVCIGCRMCMAACPYGARVFNWEEQTDISPELHDDRPEFTVPQRQGTVGKCTLCVHHLEANEFPACVESCSMKVIYVGNLVTDSASNGRETVILSKFLRDNDAFRFREELGTKPRVYYIAGHGQDLDY
jgi:molybdopterin-containing oxidoreductase family iron-sulfur binding subunit